MSKLKAPFYPLVHHFNHIFFTLFFGANRFRYRLEPLEDLSGERVLILAPHVDDDVIGCGGLLARLPRICRAVKCVYLTDGSRSIHPYFTPEQLAELRRGEGEQVAEFYGLEPPSFLNVPDGQLSADEETCTRLAREVKDFEPTAVFLPSLLDGHRDHTTTSPLLLRALDRVGLSENFPLHLYQVNSPLTFYTANRCFPLTRREKEAKKRAMEIFASQTLPFEGFLTLDRCRRAALPRSLRQREVEAAEFFRRTTKEEHEMILNSITAGVYRNFRQLSRPYTLVRDFFSGWGVKKEAGRILKGRESRAEDIIE